MGALLMTRTLALCGFALALLALASAMRFLAAQERLYSNGMSMASMVLIETMFGRRDRG